MKTRLFALFALVGLVLAGCNSDVADNETNEGPSAPVAHQEDASSAPVAATPPAGEREQALDPAPTTPEAEVAEAAPPSKPEFLQRAQAALETGDVGQAVEVLEEAHQAYPDDNQLMTALLQISSAHGRTLAETDPQAAADSFLKTARLTQEALGPPEEADPAVGPFYADAMFNAARAHALKGDPEAAKQALQAAVNLGFEEVSKLEDDPFLEPLREDPQFAETLAALKEQIKQNLREEVRQELADAESFDFDFELVNLDGETVTKGDYEGKILIVDVWGTWCPPCLEEIPHFIELLNNYGDDLAIVGINYEHGDEETAKQTVKEFAAEQAIPYTLVMGNEAVQEQIPDFGAFPTTLFLDRSGKVRLKLVGYHSYEKLEAILTELLENKPAA